ncbi:hypothetical protein BASA81_008558 [Batrachochytrium salamandrivorans]|nr:hypothetical protein BASA81_008558 [Batrachochytrium salamandrivorans]
MFEELVKNKLRSTEEQLRDAASRLEARIGEQELAISLAENRVALSLDPRHEEKLGRLKQTLAELDALLGEQEI